MATDIYGIEELIPGLDANFLRFCPIHKLPHDPDPRIYFGAGRLCPCGGEPLIGYLARQRQNDAPQDALPSWMGLED